MRLNRILVLSLFIIVMSSSGYCHLLNIDSSEHGAFSGIEEFTPNKRVNEMTTDLSGSPSVAFEDGTIYVVWHSKGSGLQHISFSKSMNNGTTFSPNIMVDPLGDATQKTPRIAVSGKDIYVVWEDFRNGQSDIFLARSPDGGATFEPSVQVNDDPEDTKDYMPSVAVDDGSGAIYVAWVHGYAWVSMVSHPEIHVARSQDKGYSFQQTKVSDNDLYDRFNPSIGVDGNGKVYVAWSDGRGGPIPGMTPPDYDFDVYIANSTDGGATFGTNTVLNEMILNKRQRNPSIAVDSSNRLHAVWVDERFEDGKYDIMYSSSLDGSTFGENVLVNNSSPSVSGTLVTDHQSPSVSVNHSGSIIHVVWLSNRGGDKNVYIARSTDGGQTFGPASSRFGGSHFFDHVPNGVYDDGEAVILDDGNDALDPGVLNGTDSEDRIVLNGSASLVRDTSGAELAYLDSNTDDAWDPSEPIIFDAPLTEFTIEVASSRTPWDNTSAGNSLSSLRNNDSSYYRVNRSEVMGIGGFDIPAGLLDPDPISSVLIRITYNTSAGYSGSVPVYWSLEGGSNNSLFVPVDTGGFDLNFSAQLFPVLDSVDEIRTMNVSFQNDDTLASTVRFDEIELVVSRGWPLKYDAYDALVYNGSIPVLSGDALHNFSTSDRIVYMDSNGNGAYTLDEPVIKLGHDLTILTDGDTVLEHPTNGKWKTYLCPFPLNDDLTFSEQTNPSLATDRWGNVYAVWQDPRESPSDIYYTDNIDDLWPPSVSQIDATASYIEVTFSEPVNTSSFDSSYSISPNLAGSWSWDPSGYIATFQSSVQVLPSVRYDIVITTGLRDLSGNQMSANFLHSFRMPALPIIIHDAVTSTETKKPIPLGARIIDLDGIDSAIVFHRTAGEFNYTASNMSLSWGTTPNGYWTFSIPPQSNLSAIDYYIVATDAVNDTSRAPFSGSYSIEVVDFNKPAIQHASIPSARIGDELLLEARVTDDLGVESVLVYVKPIGAADFNPPLLMTGVQGNYSVSIDVGNTVGTLEYYIRAVDAYGNEALSPDGGKWAPHEVELYEDTYNIVIFGFQAAAVVMMVARYSGSRKKRGYEA